MLDIYAFDFDSRDAYLDEFIEDYLFMMGDLYDEIMEEYCDEENEEEVEE